MATSYTTTIKNLKPQGWSRQTVADGQALNNSFLEPTHQKDLKLAEGLDATNDRIDSVNTQMTTLGQRVSNAESTVANIGEEVQSYSQEIAQLNSNLQIVSATEGDLATSLGTVTEKLNEHKNLVSVDSTTIAGDGSEESPYTVIGGGGGGGVSKVYVPNVDGGNLSYTLSAASAAESQIGPWDIKGPKGNDGAKGNDATPLTATTATVAGGTQVTISYTSGGDPLAQFNVLSGASGENGIDGISPTVVTAAIPVSDEFPAGGTEVTITDSDGPHIFNISNGLDGQGATVNLLGGEGIEVNKTGANYTISVSADYSGAAVASAKNWVNAQGYVLSGALNPENSVSGKWRNGQYYDFGLKASAENALAAVDGKMVKPSGLTNGTYILNVNNGGQSFSWLSLQADELVYKEYLNDCIYPENGLSARFDSFNGEAHFGLATSGIDANKQYAWTTTGWEEVQAGGGGTDYDIIGNNGISAKKDTTNERYEVGLSAKFLQTVSADTNTLSGNGTSGSPLGIDSNNLYELDTAGSYLSSQTVGQKTLISTTPALDNAVQKVIDKADTWDTVSAKSVVTINKATNEIKINNNANSAISATIYDVCNTSELALIPQRLIVGTSSGDFVTYVNDGKCEGQGTLFFWLESMQPWVPVNN